MAGRGMRIAIGGLVLAWTVAPTAAGATGHSRSIARPFESARFVTHTSVIVQVRTTRSRTVGSIDFRHRRSQETTRPHGAAAAEVRRLGPDLYYRGARDSGATPARPWVHQYDDFVGSSFFDPAELTSADRRRDVRIERVGRRRTADGVAVTEYRLSPSVRVEPKLRALGYTRYGGHQQIWVDEQRRIRRWQRSGTTPDGQRRLEDTTYSDFGAAVHVERPPADEITEDAHSVEPPRAKGPPQTIGAGTADGIVWRVRLIPTTTGACLNLESGHRPQPFGLRIRGSELLGVPCSSRPTNDETFGLQLDVLHNGAQVISGALPDRATDVSAPLDDGTTIGAPTRHGGVAFAMVGNRAAPTLVVHGTDREWSCNFQAYVDGYECEGGAAPPPPVFTSPATSPNLGT